MLLHSAGHRGHEGVSVCVAFPGVRAGGLQDPCVQGTNTGLDTVGCCRAVGPQGAEKRGKGTSGPPSLEKSGGRARSGSSVSLLGKKARKAWFSVTLGVALGPVVPREASRSRHLPRYTLGVRGAAGTTWDKALQP